MSGPSHDVLAAVLSRVRPVASIAEADALTRLLAAPWGPPPGAPCILSFVNQHALNLCWARPEFAELLCQADVLLRDGLGAELALRRLGRPTGLNMEGTSLIPRLAAAFAGRRVALYGTTDPWLRAASSALRALGCDPVTACDGYQDIAHYVAAARRDRPELVILAMGMPRQEQVAARLAAALDWPVLIANGGAVADHLGGRVRRAPAWVRRARLEWAFRLALEPRRLFHRYVTGGAAFLWRIQGLHPPPARRPA